MEGGSGQLCDHALKETRPELSRQGGCPLGGARCPLLSTSGDVFLFPLTADALLLVQHFFLVS